MSSPIARKGGDAVAVTSPNVNYAYAVDFVVDALSIVPLISLMVTIQAVLTVVN